MNTIHELISADYFQLLAPHVGTVRYSDANSKLKKLYKVPELKRWLIGRKVYSFDLLSGKACPMAKACKSMAVELPNGKRTIQDGPDTEFRCFSASQEVQYTGVYNKRKANFDGLRNLTTEDMVLVLTANLPADTGIMRIHVAGDFFNLSYFRAWQQVARNNPHMLFYAYTKSLSYWVSDLEDIPQNLVLTASRGGSLDHLIDQYNLREAKVVFSEFQAKTSNLDIDDDDSHAARPDLKDTSFALLIHGTQPKGSDAGKALQLLKKYRKDPSQENLDNIRNHYIETNRKLELLELELELES